MTTTHPHQLVLKHQKLLHLVAQRFKAVADYNDVIGAGQLGLLQAARKFDPHRGYKFSTFALPYIRSSMQRALGKEYTVRVPEKRLKKEARLPFTVALEQSQTMSVEGGIGRAHARAMLMKLQAQIRKLPKTQHTVMLTRFFSTPEAFPLPFRRVAAKLRVSVARAYQLEQQARWTLGLACSRNEQACCHEAETGICLVRAMT